MSGLVAGVAFKEIAGSAASGIWNCLTVFAKWIGPAGVILSAILAIDHVDLIASHRHSAKVEKQLVKCGEQTNALSEKLRQISNKRNQQRIITQTRIVTVTKRIHDADIQAQKVEQAPPAPACHTNSAVMNADV